MANVRHDAKTVVVVVVVDDENWDGRRLPLPMEKLLLFLVADVEKSAQYDDDEDNNNESLVWE